MLKTILFNLLKKQVEDAIRSGKIGELISKLLGDLLTNGKLSITVDGTPANDTLKDILVNALLNVVRDLLASGKLNDLIIKLLQGLLGSKSFSLPVTATSCGDIELESNTLRFTHDDGTTYDVDLSGLLA
jgi:hypothetical protein